MQADINEAAVNVDDIIDAEPMYEWDRNNPDMSVGTCYPSMDEFRGKCAALGCPWFIRARTQHDDSVRV